MIGERAGRLRIWSAGCGSGQEVYSLAMCLAETPQAPVQVEIVATDLCERSLGKAKAGLYSQFEVQRGLSARRLITHFENSGDLFKASARLQQDVRWRRINLAGDVAALGPFDLILCRHVLGGLVPDARPTVLAGLTAALAPGGRLVLSPSDLEVAGLKAVGPGIFGQADEACVVVI